MKLLKIVGKLILWLIIAILSVWLVQYFFASYYNFPSPKPFSGDKIFNPYAGLDSNFWRKSNFQVQSSAWIGITDGSQNTNEAIDSTYRFLDYDVIGISDYMKINEYKKDIDPYIPLYEHGYNILKRHQVCIAAKEVNWFDYALWQTIHHKQDIINTLRDQVEVMVIAHPNYEGGYKAEDFKYLRGFDGIEILNYFRQSIEHWDTALSVGNYVIGIGDDDVHDIFDPDEVGQYCTYIYSESLNGDSIVKAMKEGKVYAAHIHRDLGESFEKKQSNLRDIARFIYAKMHGDTFHVKVDREAQAFLFIGQNGEVKKRVPDVDSAFYVVQENDTYIRTQIHFPDKNVLYLAAIAKYSGTWPPKMKMPTVNPVKTWIYRIILAATIIFIVLNVILIRRRIKRKKKEHIYKF